MTTTAKHCNSAIGTDYLKILRLIDKNGPMNWSQICNVLHNGCNCSYESFKNLAHDTTGYTWNKNSVSCHAAYIKHDNEKLVNDSLSPRANYHLTEDGKFIVDQLRAFEQIDEAIAIAKTIKFSHENAIMAAIKGVTLDKEYLDTVIMPIMNANVNSPYYAKYDRLLKRYVIPACNFISDNVDDPMKSMILKKNKTSIHKFCKWIIDNRENIANVNVSDAIYKIYDSTRYHYRELLICDDGFGCVPRDDTVGLPTNITGITIPGSSLVKFDYDGNKTFAQVIEEMECNIIK